MRKLLFGLVFSLAPVVAAAQLSTGQLTTLRNAINATPAWAAYPIDGDGPTDLAAVLNAPANPVFNVWRSDCKTSAVTDAINWATYTPTDTISEADTDPALSRRIGRLLMIQVKQMNLQIMLQGRDSINTSLPNIRAGLRDAVIQVPSGTNGANTSPGGASGATVLTACVRNATEAERVLITASSGSDTTGTVTARVLGFEGQISPNQIITARNLP